MIAQPVLPLLGICLLAGPASAWTHGGGSCNHHPAGYADGCVGAPSPAQFLAPTATDSFGGTSWYGYAVQSGQTWINPHPWPWDQAGIDYAIGPVQTQAASLDPATLPTSGAVCTYSASAGATGGGAVFCSAYNGNTVADLEGYNFGLRGGVVLTIQSSITSTILKNDWFKYGANADINGQGYVLKFQGGGNVDVESSMFDGNYPTYLAVYPQSMIVDSRYNPVSTNFTFRYTAMINSPERPFAANSYSANRLFQYDYFDSFGLAVKGQHQEVLEDSTPLGNTVASVVYSFSTVRQPRFNAAGTGAAGITTFSNLGTAAQDATIIYAYNDADQIIMVANKSISGTGFDNVVSRGFWLAYNTFLSADWNENYIDPSGMYWAYSTATAASVNTTNWHGNNSVSLIDGSPCYGYDAAQSCTGHQ